MANCSIIRNPNTNYIEKVLAPNGKNSRLYENALNHLREVKNDVIQNQAQSLNDFKFQEEGVTITLKREDNGRVYLKSVEALPNYPITNVFNRVLDKFDKEGFEVYVDKNSGISELLLAHAGFMDSVNEPDTLHREVEKFKAIPSEHLKEQALTLWRIAYTDTFAETMGKWNFTEEELKEAESFIKRRKREIEQVQTYNALKGRILAEKYKNLQRERVRFQIVGERGLQNSNDTYRKQQLETAKTLKEAGADNRLLWETTGWYNTQDGWKSELSDGKIIDTTFPFESTEEGFENKVAKTKLENFYHNPSLYEFYPSLRDIEVVFYKEPETSSLNQDNGFVEGNKIFINDKNYGFNEARENREAEKIHKGIQSLTHEIQHLIQGIEGFERGGSENTFRRFVETQVGVVRNLLNDGSNQSRARAESIMEHSGISRMLSIRFGENSTASHGRMLASMSEQDIQQLIEDVSYYNYLRMAGEVEARNVANRLSYTEEYKQNKSPLDTEEFYEKDKIYSNAEQLFPNVSKSVKDYLGEFFSEEIQEKKAFQDKVLRKIQNVFAKKFHNFNIVRNMEDFSNRLGDENLLRTNGGKIMGAVLDDGTIFIDKDNFSVETTIHEASHLWEKLNPQLWSEGVDKFKDALSKSEELQNIVESVRRNQPHLEENQVYSEALNDFIGKWGDKSINEKDGKLDGLLKWLKDFFNSIFSLFNPSIKAEKNLNDFAKMVVSEIVGEKKLQTFFDNSLRNQNKGVILPSESSIKSIVAPYFKRRVRSEAELIQMVHSEDFQNFLNNAREIAKELGLPEFTYHINLGGYSFEKGNGSIQELSVTFNFEGVTREQVKLFTDLMGDVGLEFQEAVITSRYVDEYNKEDGGMEYSLKVNGVSDVMEITKRIGLTDFSYDTETRTIKVLGFPKEDNAEARKAPTILIDFVNEYNKHIENEKGKLNESSIITKPFDSYFDIDSDRRKEYTRRQAEEGNSIPNTFEREVIERAIGRNREGKPYEGEYLEAYPELLKPQFQIVGERGVENGVLYVNSDNYERRNKESAYSESKNPIMREIQDIIQQTTMSERGNTEELLERKGDGVSNESRDTNLGGVESNRELGESLLNSESLIPERFQLSTEEIFGVDTIDMKQVPVLSVSKYLEDEYATDSNGEPHLKDVLVMDNIMRNWKAAVTPAEIYKLSNDFGNVVGSVEELYQEINRTFFPSGYFHIDPELLMESKLYSKGEAITLLNHPEVQRNVQRLFEAVRKEYMSNNIYLENTLDNSKFSEELIQYKDEVDDLGKVQKEDPIEVENYFKENLAGVKDRQLFNNIVSNLKEYPQFVNRFENDLGFAEMVFNKYSNMTKIFRLQDIKDEVRVRRKGATFSKMFETLKHSEKGLEIGQDTAFLKRLDKFVWDSNAKEVVGMLRDIEEKFVDYNIDVIGLSEQYYKKSKEDILNFVENLYNFTEKLKSNDYVTEDIEKLSEDIDTFFGRDNVDADAKYEKVSENNRNKTLVELSSEKSDLELFEQQRLIKTSDGYYQKVNVKDTLEEAYDEAVSVIINNPKVINNYFLKSLPFFKNGMFNRLEVQKPENVEMVKEVFKEFIRKESNKLNDPSLKNRTETAQKWTIYKLMNKNPLNTEKMPNFASETLKYQKYRGNYHYLTNNFHADFQNYILKNKFNNTSLYNNVLKYFEVNENGIHLNTNNPLIKERIKNSYIQDEMFEHLKQYALLSKHPSMQDLFEYEEDVNNNNSMIELERYYYSNNFSQMKSFKGDYRINGDILVANNISDNFIRVKEGLFEKMGDMNGNSVYARQTIMENPNLNNYEYPLQRPSIDMELARGMVIKTSPKPTNVIKLYSKEEAKTINQQYNECS